MRRSTQETQTSRTADLAWLAALTIASALVRGWPLGDAPLWNDEALSLIISQFDYPTLFLSPVDPTPGLYYAVQKAWMTLGSSPAIVRFPALVAGVAAIPAMFWLGKLLGGTRAGLSAALLIAVMPEWIYYSREARAYSLLLLLLILSLAFLVKGVKDERVQPLALIASGVLAILALYTHVTAWFVVAPLALWTVLNIRNRVRPGWLFLWVVTGIVAVIPEIHRAALVSQAGLYNWVTHLHPYDLGRLIGHLVTPVSILFEDSAGGIRIEQTRLLRLLTVGTTLAAVGLLALIAIRSVRHGARPEGAVEIAILVTLLVLFPASLYLVGFHTPMIVPRSLLPVQIGMALLVSLYAARSRTVWAACLYAALLMTELGINFAGFKKERWDEVAEIIERADPPDGILFCPAWQAAPFIIEHVKLREGKRARRVLVDVGDRVVEISDGTLAAQDLPRAYLTHYWAPGVDAVRYAPNRTEHRDPATLGEVVVVDRCFRRKDGMTLDWFPMDRRESLAPEDRREIGMYRIFRMRPAD